MRHATEGYEHLLELRALQSNLDIDIDGQEIDGHNVVRILDQRNTPFWYAFFYSELDARKAWELWVRR